MDVDIADIARLIKPSVAKDGSHTLLLPIYNTQVSVKAFPGSRNLTGEQLDEALVAVRELALSFELELSRFRPASDISRLNAAKGAWVELGAHALDLLEKSIAYCAASGGVFDVTMGSATSLWDFHEGVIPSREALDAALRHVDYRMIEVDRAASRARLSDPEAIVDLGGIAKGYIADELAACLRAHGCDCAFVNLGGNVLTVGTRPDGTPWRIGVRDPKNPETLRAVLPAAGKSVVTSGLYERNFTKDGVFYHHILSPKDGMPVQTDVAGSTIVSDLSLDGDGYSTTLFALGVAGSLEFVESRPGLECVIIDTNDDVFVSSGLKDAIRLVQAPTR